MINVELERLGLGVSARANKLSYPYPAETDRNAALTSIFYYIHKRILCFHLWERISFARLPIVGISFNRHRKPSRMTHFKYLAKPIIYAGKDQHERYRVEIDN
jgi:hypothetical protein